MNRLFAASVIAFCLTSRCQAQSDSATSDGTLARMSAKRVVAMQLAELLNRDIGQNLGAFADSGGTHDTPQARLLRRLAAAHVAKYFRSDSVVAMTAREYEAAFTEPELHDVLGFYQSPIGSRFFAAQRRLSISIQAAGRRLLDQHQDELDEAFKSAIMLSKPSSPP